MWASWSPLTRPVLPLTHFTSPAFSSCSLVLSLSLPHTHAHRHIQRDRERERERERERDRFLSFIHPEEKLQSSSSFISLLSSHAGIITLLLFARLVVVAADDQQSFVPSSLHKDTEQRSRRMHDGAQKSAGERVFLPSCSSTNIQTV